MRIAFVSGNREKLPDAVIPLGLLYIMAATPDRHDKWLIDLCFEDRPEEALAAALRSRQPELVALGMRNVQNNDYSGLRDNIEYYDRLIATIRQVTAAPIVLGGSGFSVMPRELMERLRPDYGISGEGEGAFPALVEALESGAVAGSLRAIGSLHHFERSMLICNPPPPTFLDMGQIAAPDRSLVDARYYREYGMEAVQTKRGCPLRCEYCTYPTIEGRVGRKREPSAIVDEMFRALEAHPETSHFFVVDSVFNLPRAHAKECCRELIARGWSVPWTCYANPLGFDSELAELARAAGCAGMEIGSDSGCDEVLERLRKGFTVADIRRIHDQCQAAGLRDCHTFILGTRGERLDDVRRTLDFVVELDPFAAIIMIWIDDYEALDPVLRAERRRLRAEIEEVLLDRRAQYDHWAIPPMGVNFGEELFSRLRREGCHGPMWQHMRTQSSFSRQLTRRDKRASPGT
jgi:radical SAM superfamily enzyme YgiQ (UPF0313 family)